MPYFETRIEKEMRTQGRLKGRPGYYDYDFIPVSLNDCYSTVLACFAEWMWSAEGVTNMSKWAINYFAVNDHFGLSRPGIESHKEKFRNIASESNRYMLDTLAELFNIFESGSYLEKGRQAIDKIRTDTQSRHRLYRRTVRECFL
jgi:hypothetical protein